MNRFFLVAFCVAIMLSGCGRKKVRVTAPRPTSPRPATPTTAPSVPAGTVERGVASWYGHPYHGRPAADGEIYDMEQMVAAHRTLPFQTMVRVHNLANDKTVDVRIIDRGPFVGNRIIDISHAAAQAIEMIGSGIAQVEVTVLSSPPTVAPPEFAVQVGAFREKTNADRMEQRMASAYGAAKQVLRQGDPPLWRVLAGREPSPEAAETLAIRIRQQEGVPQAFVVRLDP